MKARVAMSLSLALSFIASGGVFAAEKVTDIRQDPLPPLFEKDRPDWEIRFADVSYSVLSVMPGESNKTFFDPLLQRNVKWEQDVYCPTFTVFGGKLYCVYRAFGDDSQWRFGLAWSDDGLHFTRSEKPVLYARPEDLFLGSLLKLKDTSVSYEDAKIYAGEDGTFYLLFNYFCLGKVRNQQLAVATSRDLVNWTHHGRIFARQAAEDMAVIPERAPWRFPHPAIVYRLQGDRFVAAKIHGTYWMYLNCLSTKGRCCVCAATSENMIDWQVLRDGHGELVNPLPLRPGYFDSDYIDTTAARASRRRDLADPQWDQRESPTREAILVADIAPHYPAQALFDRNDPTRLLKRSESPFKGGDQELEKQPIVFWPAELYESWSLVPWKGACRSTGTTDSAAALSDSGRRRYQAITVKLTRFQPAVPHRRRDEPSGSPANSAPFSESFTSQSRVISSAPGARSIDDRPARNLDFSRYSTIICPFITIQWPGKEHKKGYRPGVVGRQRKSRIARPAARYRYRPARRPTWAHNAAAPLRGRQPFGSPGHPRAPGCRA